MFSRIRKRITYTNVLVTAALVFAMAGGAYAANKVLITSTKQISKKVIAELKGKTGPVGSPGPAGPKGDPGAPGAKGDTGGEGKEGKIGPAGNEGPEGKPGGAGAKGATGPAGATGPKGVTGTEGSPWTLGGVVPAGKTIEGQWLVAEHASGENQSYGTGVSFVLPFAKTPTAHWIMENGEEAITAGEQKSTACLGSAAAPSATTGQLCIYTDSETGLSTSEPVNKFFFQWKWGLGMTATSTGFDVHVLSAEEGAVGAGGSWAATAE